MKKYATKRRGSIAPRALIKTRKFITAMGFTVLVQRGIIASYNIIIVWNKYSVDCCVCLPYTLYFILQNRFFACFILFPLIPPCYNPYVCSDWLFDIVFLDCLNACDDSPVKHLNCTGHIYAYNRLLKMGMIWCKKHYLPFDN